MYMNYKVYELINLCGSIEYVGQTKRSLKDRFYEHVKSAPNGNGNGKFHGRQDLTILEVESFETRGEALALESSLKQEHGLHQSELIQRRNALQNSATKWSQITSTCPHCGKEGRGTAMFTWHFENCKFKI